METEATPIGPFVCVAVMDSVLNDRPSWWRVASYSTASSARPSRGKTACSDFTVFVGRSRGGGPHELRQQLPAEDTVVGEVLIA